MKERLEKIVEQGFRDLQKSLLDRIEASLEPVEAWLRAEKEAESTLPSSRDSYLDETVLMSLLQKIRKRSRLDGAEWERIERVKTRVGEFRSRIRQIPPS